jgi:3-hydroxyisobutyryl-CoA hydrolase
LFSRYLEHPPFFLFDSTDDPHGDVESVLTGYKKEPESEAQLEKLLPHIISCFSTNKSVAESVEELKKYDQSGDTAGSLL